MDYPEEIADDEPVCRVLKSPHFVKNSILRPSAFRPQVNTNKISVVRWLYREQPDSVAKATFKAIGNSGQNSYCGLAVLLLEDCKKIDVELTDARDEYQGHAHIVFPYTVAANEPLEGDNFVKQTEIARKLIEACEYVPDPDPQSEDWTIDHPKLPR